MMKNLNWKFIFCVVLLLAILIWYLDSDIIYNVSYAEEMVGYGKDQFGRPLNAEGNLATEADLRYDPKLNPHGELWQVVDVLLFAAWWGLFLAGTYIK